MSLSLKFYENVLLFHLLKLLLKNFILHLILSNIYSMKDVFLQHFFLTDKTFSSSVLKSFGILKEGIIILQKTSKNFIKFNKKLKKEQGNKKRRS